MTWFRTY